MRPVPAAAIVAALASMVSGCLSESADLGRPTPVVLATPQAVLDPPVHGLRAVATRSKVLQAITEIGEGDVQSVRVRIYARSERDGESLSHMLVGLGVDPARLTIASVRHPNDRLVMTRSLAETAPCALSIAPVEPDDPLPSLISLARCTQTKNLADMLVDPGDLVAPPRLAPEDGQYLIDGVQSWRQSRSQTLPSQDGGGFGGGGSSGGGAASRAYAGAASTSAVAAPTVADTGTVTGAPAASTAPAASPVQQ